MRHTLTAFTTRRSDRNRGGTYHRAMAGECPAERPAQPDSRIRCRFAEKFEAVRVMSDGLCIHLQLMLQGGSRE